MILECGCPSSYPAWHDEDVDLGGYFVHTLPIPTLLHMPLAYEMYLHRQQQAVQQLQLTEPWPGLVLARTGLFRGSITRLLEDTGSMSRHVQHWPRPYRMLAYLHHGNVSTMRHAIREVQAKLLDAGRMPRELYLCHLTCPRCAEERGGEKILLLRHWRESGLLKKRIGDR